MTWASDQIADSTCHGHLSLGGVSMNTPQWATTNNYILWGTASRRGANTTIPGTPGREANPRRKDETAYTLEGLVIGAGSPALASNWMTLRSGILSLASATVGAALLLPNGTLLTGTAQIMEAELGATGVEGALTFTIDLVLPDGELA